MLRAYLISKHSTSSYRISYQSNPVDYLIPDIDASKSRVLWLNEYIYIYIYIYIYQH